MTLARPRRGESVASGSVATTSSAAPPRWPASRAAMSAPSSTSGPRAVLITWAPRFILAKVAAFMRPRVAGINGAWTDTKSERASRSSKLTPSTPAAASTSGATNGSWARTRSPKALAVGAARARQNVARRRALGHAQFRIDALERRHGAIERRKDAVGDGDQGTAHGRAPRSDGSEYTTLKPSRLPD